MAKTARKKVRVKIRKKYAEKKQGTREQSKQVEGIYSKKKTSKVRRNRPMVCKRSRKQ